MNNIYESFYQYIDGSAKKDIIIYHYVYGIPEKRLKDGKSLISDCKEFITNFTVGKSNTYTEYIKSLFRLAVLNYSERNGASFSTEFVKKEELRKKQRFFSLIISFMLLFSMVLVMFFYPPANYSVISFYENKISRSGFIDIKYADKESKKKLEDCHGIYMPTVIPRGYSISDIRLAGDINVIYYNCLANDNRIIFTRCFCNSKSVIDTERPENAKEIKINGIKVYITYGQDETTAIWHSKTMLFKLVVLDEEQIDVIEFVKKIKMLP